MFQEELAARLIQKSGRGVTLIVKGEALYRELDASLCQLERTWDKYFKKSPKNAAGGVVVGGGAGATANLLPSLIAKLVGSSPGAQVRLVASMRDGDVEERILKGFVDIGVVTNPVAYDALQTELYRREKLVAFVAANHALSRKRAVSMEDLERVPIVARLGQDGEDRTGGFLLRLVNGKIKLNNTIGAESTSGLKALVRRGAGIGIIYRDAIAEELRTGRFKVLKFPLDLTVETMIVYNREKPLSSLAASFLELLRAARRRRR